MECDICGKPGFHHPVHCVTCARSAIELPRIELVKILIDRDSVGKHVSAVIEGSDDRKSQHVSLNDSRGGLLVDRHECTKNVDLQRAKVETAEIEERLQLITDEAARLREQMETTRREIAAKKAAINQRKSDLSSATYGIESRRANELDKVQQNTKRMSYKSEKLHHETVEVRVSRCTMAARLAGLKVSKRRTKDGGAKEVVNIGPGVRLRIYDLRDLNDAPSDNLSASLGAVAQLVVLIASYAGVRLPAEITMPHADYPFPTIFRPESSYQGKKVPFPGSTPFHSSSNSPEASRTLEPRQLPKPRTLFTDRRLTHLAAEDPPAYSLFIEGVTLLAYNIAWLCRTQGMKDAFEHWEDVCPMGRNLYRLLIVQETRTPLKVENPLDKDIAPARSATNTPAKIVSFGELSHATSHSFAGTAENMQYLQGWKVSPTKLSDHLKSFLLAEQQTQEWDILDEKEWDDMVDQVTEEPIMVGQRKRDAVATDGARSILTNTTMDTKGLDTIAENEGEVKGEGKKRGVRGTSGWTKVKSRSEDVINKE